MARTHKSTSVIKPHHDQINKTDIFYSSLKLWSLYNDSCTLSSGQLLWALQTWLCWRCWASRRIKFYAVKKDRSVLADKFYSDEARTWLMNYSSAPGPQWVHSALSDTTMAMHDYSKLLQAKVLIHTPGVLRWPVLILNTIFTWKHIMQALTGGRQGPALNSLISFSRYALLLAFVNETSPVAHSRTTWSSSCEADSINSIPLYTFYY